MFDITTNAVASTDTNITEQLKVLGNAKLGPRELNAIGEKIAEMVLATVPEGYSLRGWVRENEAEIDRLIFANFDNDNLVHALQFAELALRKYE